jgi:hypothetical protein
MRSVRFAITFALALFSAIPAVSDSVLPVVWYRADGTAQDGSGAHNGTLVNGAGFASSPHGQAFALNGVDQYVQIPDSSAWAFGSGDFTIDIWARFAFVNTGSQTSFSNTFISSVEGLGPSQKSWALSDSGGGLTFEMNHVFFTASFSPSLATWYNIVLTRSGCDLTFYVNFQTVGTATDCAPFPDVTAPLMIGQADQLFQSFFNGNLDEVRLYDNALTLDQIQEEAKAVPEPSTIALTATSLLGLLLRRRRSGPTA